MADFTNTKRKRASTYPADAIDGSSFKRVEPLITPDQVKSRYLFGLPLTSPITGERVTNEMIADKIIQAANYVEDDAQIDIFPVQRQKRMPFQREAYDSYIYTELPNKPVLSIEKLAIVTSNGQTIYTIPHEWIDTANFNQGRVNVIPLSPASGGSGNALILGTGNAVGGFLLFLSTQAYLPAYWECDYTTGFRFPQGVPIIINQLIGMKTAMYTLRNLIPTVQFSSHSLGLDGVSQSQSNQAAQLYEKVYTMLKADYDELKDRIQLRYNNRIIAGSLS